MYTKRIITGVVTHSVSGFPAIGETVALRQAVCNGDIVFLVRDLKGDVWLAEWSICHGYWIVKASEHYPVMIIE